MGCRGSVQSAPPRQPATLLVAHSLPALLSYSVCSVLSFPFTRLSEPVCLGQQFLGPSCRCTLACTPVQWNVLLYAPGYSPLVSFHATYQHTPDCFYLMSTINHLLTELVHLVYPGLHLNSTAEAVQPSYNFISQ